MVKILIKKLDKNVKIPQYKTEGSSGMDLIANIKKSISISPGVTNIIPTGISVSIPIEYELQIRPRSGLAAKNSITVLNTPGTIDSDYRGEIKVILINLGNKEFQINPNDRIAQMVLCHTIKVEFKEVEVLEETKRGSGGFGSTGIKDK
jgi:dUTP pyrophosphatase